MDIYKEERPWGSFEQFTKNQLTTVKILTIKSGQAFSLQYHHNREEFWRVLTGNPKITVGDKTVETQPGDEFYIAVKQNHRIEAQDQDVTVLEISLGEFDEEDIVRLEDKYGRK